MLIDEELYIEQSGVNNQKFKKKEKASEASSAPGLTPPVALGVYGVVKGLGQAKLLQAKKKHQNKNVKKMVEEQGAKSISQVPNLPVHKFSR